MKLLLDTHSFLWLITGDKRLSQTMLYSYQHAEHVYLSSISVWEIAQKHHLGKLPLPDEAAPYIKKNRELHQIKPLLFSENDAAHLAQLPNIHRDPFDRMLICQAIEHGLALVTDDRFITSYPIKTIW